MQQQTLLIVDDEKGILRALRRLFRRSGYRLLIADSGEEALQLLAEYDVQVIITDFRMPGMTGGQLLEQAAVIYPEMVGMILSGYADLKSIIDTFDKGVVYKFLTKPWDDDNLLREAKRAFEISAQKALELDSASVRLPEESLESTQSDALPLERVLDRDHFVSLVSTALTQPHKGALLVADMVDARPLIQKLSLNNTLELVRLLSRELLEMFGRSLDLCHWGSNRFLLWLPDREKISEEWLLESFENLSSRLGSETNLFCLGAATSEQNDLLENLILKAQAARFKAATGELVLFDESVDMRVEQQETALLRAINESDLTLVYQPIADGLTGELHAVEALVRAPELPEALEEGAIAIPVAADNLGITARFSSWLINTALDQYLDLLKLSGFKAKLALNLSLWQLESDHFVENLAASLTERGLNFEQLQFDLSENVLINARKLCQRNIQALNELGVELVLDDQGTAFSLLRSSYELPVKRVKLDRSFVRDLMKQPSQQEMLLHMCNLIQKRGLEIGIVGLEEQSQMDFLRARFKFLYQGHLLSAPLTSKQFADWYISQMNGSH